MKNIWKIALMVAALMTSCSQPDLDELNPNEGANGKEIKFYTEANRTTYFEGEGLGINWEVGDEVPIIARSFFDGLEKRVRKYYTAASAGASTTFTSTAALTWDTALNTVPMNTIDVDFYAFHCGYKRSTSTTIYNGITVYSSPVQEQSVAGDDSHIGNYTVLASNKVSRPVGNTEPIGFQFTNCMSIVELTLKGDATRKIKSVTLTSENAPLQFDEAFLCVEDLSSSADVVEEPYTIILKDGKGTVDGKASSTVTVTLNDWTTLSAEGIKLYFVVLPGAHEAGDITLSTIDKNGSMASVKMGAITFEKNKVYRPAVNLTFGEAEEGAPIATIKHTFTDDKPYGDPIVLVEGVQPILDRTYGIYNVPEEVKYLSIATINCSSYPSINKIEALTGGSVYVMLGQSKLVSNGIHQNILDAGWEAITPATDTKVAADFAEGQVYYDDKAGDAEVSGTWTIYKRTMTAGEEYDLTELSDLLGAGFQGIRPIAAVITNECVELPGPDGVPVKMDFSSLPDGWTLQPNFTGVLNNPIKGKIEMAVESTLTNKIELDFSYIDGGAAGSAYHKEKYLLMNMNGKINPLSVGFPAMEGYKLTAVELVPLATAKVKPNICMSSTPAPGEATSVSGGFVQWNHANGNIVLNIANSVVNTPYYLYALGGDNTVRIQAITLYYEPAE